MFFQYLKQRASILAIIALCAFVVYNFTFVEHQQQIEIHPESPNPEFPMKHFEKQLLKMHTIIKERNDLSKRLNMLTQSYSLLRCSISNEVSDTGGWCSKHLNGSHMTDNSLAETLAKMFSNQTIASFGEGPGNYKRLLKKTGLIEVYDGFDGSPDVNNMTNDEVKFLDLTIPHYGLPVYDWIFSFEVAEHIPEKYESFYVSNVIRHARKGVVISWAVPGQGGTAHVNLKSHIYVIEKLNSLCFIKDDEKSNILRNSSGLPWLRNNLMVFHRHPTCPLDEDEA